MRFILTTTSGGWVYKSEQDWSVNNVWISFVEGCTLKERKNHQNIKFLGKVTEYNSGNFIKGKCKLEIFTYDLIQNVFDVAVKTACKKNKIEIIEKDPRNGYLIRHNSEFPMLDFIKDISNVMNITMIQNDGVFECKELPVHLQTTERGVSYDYSEFDKHSSKKLNGLIKA
jgi:hypothetical protein